MKLNNNAKLQKQIAICSKTRNAHIEYFKAGYSNKFMALHEADIILNQAAMKYFDGLGLTKLPIIASLRAEYAEALEEKKQIYADYHQARDEMKELTTARANADDLFSDASHREREREYKRGEQAL